jgi:hypothetical protein
MDGHDVNTAEQMTTTIAHTDLVKKAMQKLELNETVRGRANLAGVQLGTEPPGKITYSIEMGTPMDPEQIALICLKAVHVVEGGLDPEEQIAFLQFRQDLTLLQRATDESKTNREINQDSIFVNPTIRLVTKVGVTYGEFERKGLGARYE